MPKASDPNLLRGTILTVQDPVAGGPLSDGSLWQDINWTADFRARRVNDLLTIRITEKTNAVVKGDAATSRTGANTMKATGLANKLIPGVADGSSVTSNTAMSFKGSGNTGRSAAITTTITARVVKVLANGNLVFEGYRDIQLNNETQRLYVAGMVNPVFLDSGNGIASSQVAELRLGYGGKGVVDETTKPGYVSRLLNYVWPY
jgi:flagellar L-ring protein precursor FlgH